MQQILLNIEKDERYLRLGVVDCLFFPLLAFKLILLILFSVLELVLANEVDTTVSSFCISLIISPFVVIEILATALRHIAAFFLSFALLPAIACFDHVLKTQQGRRYSLFQEYPDQNIINEQESETENSSTTQADEYYRHLEAPPPYTPNPGSASGS